MLVKQESLQTYFHENIQNALHNQNVEAQDHTVSYLTNLLTSFTRSENFIDCEQGRAVHRPLAVYYSEAIHSTNEHARDQALRRLGDIALFICGLFSDSLNKKAVDVDYYVAMGGTAYGCLSQSNYIHNKLLPLKDVFSELSNKFIDFVDVLSELNENQNKSNENILRVYELWLKTNSKKAKKLLVDQGILPISNEASIKIQ